MPNRIEAVLLDFGDTLGDQASEERDETGFLYGVELVEGARELLVALRERGYRVALVVDGDPDENAVIRARHGLDPLLDAVAVSGEVGSTKPDHRLFEVALDRLGVPREHADRVVMVGNRLERDVRGANELGMTTVWIAWSPRYRKDPLATTEAPHHVIDRPLELLDVLDRIEAGPAGR